MKNKGNKVYLGRYKVAGVDTMYLPDYKANVIKAKAKRRILDHLKDRYLCNYGEKIKWAQENINDWNFDLDMKPYGDGHYEANVYISFISEDDAVLFKLVTE